CGHFFDIQDVIYDFLVTGCSNTERLSTFDIEGDKKTRGETKKLAEYVMLFFDFFFILFFRACTTQVCKPISTVLVLWSNSQEALDMKSMAQISEQIEHEDEYMWTVTSGADLSVKVKFSVSVPLVYSFSSELSTTLKTSSGSTTVETRTTRQWIKQDVAIPPGATIEAKWLVNKAQVVLPWVSNISMKGYIAALFESPN
ncbi:secreted salivary gland peptide, putative, partial [Ixodes scapularis]